MAILVAPRREAALPPPLAATGRTGCRRYAQARGYRGERLTRARRPQNRAPSHLGAAWRRNGHFGCATPRGGSAASTRRHRSHRLQARRTGAGVQRGAPEASPKAAESSAQPFRCCLATEWPFWLYHAERRFCGLRSLPPFAQAAGETHRRGVQRGAPEAGPKGAEKSAPPNHRCGLPRNALCAATRTRGGSASCARRHAALRPHLVVTVRTGCRRYAQARGHRRGRVNRTVVTWL